MQTKLKKNDEIICKIESYTSEGLGVARYEGRAIFIPNTIKNEIHKVIIVKITNTVIYGKSIEIIEVSPNRTPPKCKYFSKCGGCHLQFMTYDEEISFKKQKVIDSLNHIGKQQISDITFIPSNKIERYRNKAVFNVQDEKFGFYKSRTHELIEIDDCLLQSTNSINIAKQINLKELNHISIRDTVCIVYGNHYYGTIPSGLTGFVLCENKRDNSLLDGSFNTLWGNPNQIERICGKQFIVSPRSFFQVNSSTVDILYDVACEYAGYGNFAIELYCGTGTISLCLSNRFKHIISIEIIPEAIENANENKKLNNIDNVDFICGDAANYNSYTTEQPDVILVDPPRKGLDINVIESIKNSNASKIVYISCNPSTLSRDISLLSELYYIKQITAVDMFPKTYHVETVALLCKK